MEGRFGGCKERREGEESFDPEGIKIQSPKPKKVKNTLWIFFNRVGLHIARWETIGHHCEG